MNVSALVTVNNPIGPNNCCLVTLSAVHLTCKAMQAIKETRRIEDVLLANGLDLADCTNFIFDMHESHGNDDRPCCHWVLLAVQESLDCAYRTSQVSRGRIQAINLLRYKDM
eukprot:6022277-Karenia_brevis.AAC.1